MSTEVIAAELEVTSQAILKRFRTKKELLIQSVRPCGVPRWIEVVQQGPDSRPLSEQLREILAELADFFADVVRRMELLRWSGVSIKEIMSTFAEPPPVRDIRVLREWLVRAHQQGLIRELDFDATAMFLLTAMHGPAMLTEFLGHSPTEHRPDEYVDYYLDMLLNGILKSRART